MPQYASSAVSSSPQQFRGKRQPQGGDGDVEFINENYKSQVLSGSNGGRQHGGNYRQADDYERGKREFKHLNAADLAYQPQTGFVVDERTGKAYELKPVDY